jgi:hypothetical protein
MRPLHISQTYLTKSGLAPFYADLRLLAERIVAQIHQNPGIYKPKQARGRVSTISKGWGERLRNYEWP